ncbi:hypothetical protein [Chitinimonas sp. BJYL2]|uniref:hypothetical protein n=1 Tax=Chitinimonas sp. BJYL2 TaxID=2976696 RepID=UPI0022B5B90B|nr:hypothetical protein [Chitinimonas sp. BJYL2]
MSRRTLRVLFVIVASTIATSFSHASEPAVSSPNGKLGIAVGNKDLSNIVSGSFTFGLTQGLGAQIDLSRLKYGASGATSNAAAGHLFWRDPSVGLVGTGFAHYDRHGGNGRSFSLQGERYFEQFTLRGHVGREYWNLGSLKGSDTLLRSTASWYSMPDLALHLRANRALGRNWVGVGSEWQFSTTHSAGYTFFLEAGKSRDLGTQVKAGFRIYFDSPMTLKARHRTADPEAFDNNNTNHGMCPPGYEHDQWGVITGPGACSPIEFEDNI